MSNIKKIANFSFGSQHATIHNLAPNDLHIATWHIDAQSTTRLETKQNH